MQFYHSNNLVLLWLVPALVVFYLWLWQRRMRALRSLGMLDTIKQLISSFSSTKYFWKAALLILGITFLLVGLAQPQWGEEKKQLKRRGVDIIFMVDSSLSMLAEDVKPNRLEKAKFLMKSFLRHLKGDRIGIVTFAGTGFLQSPLTLDYSAFTLFINSIFAGYIPDPGTNLSEGIKTAVHSFPESQKKYRAIVILSDGESLAGQADEAIALAKKENVKIYTVGIGSPDGEPIPLKSKEGKSMGYKKDREGQVVITRLDESFLKQLAQETEGLYFRASAAERETELIYQHMQSLGKQEFKEQLVIEREDHFQLFVAMGLTLCMFSTLLSDRRKL
ncbi:MAG: hypothetical protein COV74_01690 [Candidatus Omnitrophica bacterium CG11_big_fil_rev_8_21_14_0_20_45_26]|uniref:VWFA domain-containing protein n=1 Tax=Candidatus Abzuiibacterium crystallinum TaxID=1974748 RepID=A0A2H0LS59_9BACT|nr:MAG: hypothetical protein COV74_01690 [Candidatus Omnitrophica bacterium CG11_big_fil_rev_8_21_14_0_20_45_26]PIW65008.1 MAG: hypothetical protein COW12_03970 [Candidatus Omnitrophica bacterium CG12_big_fil_rev_8_21_14_0_65_45_16]